MDLDLDNIQVSDMINGNDWDVNTLKVVFSSQLDSPPMRMEVIDPTKGINWVWMPNSNIHFITKLVQPTCPG